MKVAFQVGEVNIKKLSTMDAFFADSLARALTGLIIDKAVLKPTARSGEQQPCQSWCKWITYLTRPGESIYTSPHMTLGVIESGPKGPLKPGSQVH